MFATVSSAVVEGVTGRPVTVEVHVSQGLPGYTLVGLPDVSCRESRDRVRAAILSSGLSWPARRVTINLAPSGVRKQGSALDLAIALGILAASGQLPDGALDGLGAIGELGLDGSVRPVAGLVCLAGAVAAAAVVVPSAGAVDAAAVRPDAVRAAASLADVVGSIRGTAPPLETPRPPEVDEAGSSVGDLGDVRGQALARWALEVSAAGGHHLLLIGPPGAGKTMLAERLVGLLPHLEAEEALMATQVHSAAGIPLPPGGLVRRPPLRAPHHGASLVSLIGGGTAALRPGEISCATGGVLFLDELGEFAVGALDALRQPLEEGVIRVSRASRSVTLPARFLLVAAMNPCPCGEGGADGRCRCSDRARARYSRRLSGPLLDRFDLRVEVRPPPPALLLADNGEETSADVAARVHQARARARDRGVATNAALASRRLEQEAPLTAAAQRVLHTALERHELTARGLDRVRRVALTIADLQGVDTIDDDVIRAALALRPRPTSVLGVAS